jgi:hypothetical protein
MAFGGGGRWGQKLAKFLLGSIVCERFFHAFSIANAAKNLPINFSSICEFFSYI